VIWSSATMCVDSDPDSLSDLLKIRTRENTNVPHAKSLTNMQSEIRAYRSCNSTMKQCKRAENTRQPSDYQCILSTDVDNYPNNSSAMK
jgi:hypothetical protein